MNDTESDKLIDDEKLDRLRAILTWPIRTDADLLELAELVEDESEDAASDSA